METISKRFLVKASKL